jgi:hypothetical protein
VIAFRDTFHATNEEADNSLQNKQHYQNSCDFRQAIADHDDNVVVPVTLDLLKDWFFDFHGASRPKVHGEFCEGIQDTARFRVGVNFGLSRCKHLLRS